MTKPKRLFFANLISHSLFSNGTYPLTESTSLPNKEADLVQAETFEFVLREGVLWNLKFSYYGAPTNFICPRSYVAFLLYMATVVGEFDSLHIFVPRDAFELDYTFVGFY